MDTSEEITLETSSSETIFGDHVDKQPSHVTIDEALTMIGFGKYQVFAFVIAGVVWIGDAMEILLLSFLSQVVSCEWDLSHFDVAILTAVVFVGVLFGTLLFGSLSDRYGRKIIYIATSAITFIFSIICALSVNFPMLVCLRFIVGFGIGGNLVAITYMVEFLPPKNRGRIIMLVEIFWALGGILEAALAWIILPTLGWRWLLVFTASPLIFAFILVPFAYPSPRHLLLIKKDQESLDVLKKVARFNGKELPDVSLVLSRADEEETGNFKQLFTPYLRKTTLILMVLWAGLAFFYYGAVLLTTEIEIQTMHGHR
eukprot:TRINITY_DN9385_c0_g1_i1.p1 TRINITY_DN9385_c0_g1~~TRINITY_DN9385_c0_g1_i1.p1  ORF type:complete len:314 (+),score=55.86 TRINITY_DN9385_c0_g1_i1:59-1000(+)